MSFANAKAIEQYLIARIKAIGVGLQHFTHQINAWHHWKASYHRGLARYCQGIFIINVGIGDFDDHFAFGQVVNVQLFKTGANNAFAVGCRLILNSKCFERAH